MRSAGTCATKSAGLWALAAELQDTAVLDQLRAAGQLYPCDPEVCQILLRHGDKETALWILHSHGTCQDLTASGVCTQWIESALADDAQDSLQCLRSITPDRLWQRLGLYSMSRAISVKRLLRSHAFQCPCRASDWAQAARQESLDELELLDSTRMLGDQPWDKDLCNAAAQTGRMPTVDWLWERVPAEFWADACCQALNAERFEVIRWLLQQVPPCPFEPQLFPDNWGPPGSRVQHPGIRADAGAGWAILHIHSQLPSQGLLDQIPMEPYACRQAAASNNFELMYYLREKQCPWDARACNLAAAKGHMEMLQWMRRQDPPCPWGPHTCQLAAENDHLDILTWLLAQQPACPFPQAPERVSDRCMQHLIVMGCPMQTQAAKARARAFCPLPVSLVLGLYRWYKLRDRQATAPFRLTVQAPEDDMLAHMSCLQPENVWDICHLAGLCRTGPWQRITKQ